MPGDSTSAVEPGHIRLAHDEALGNGGIARRRRVVPRNDIGAHRPQRRRRRQAVAAEADHGEALSGEDVGRKVHRIFNVARPTSARIMAMIQKRMTMVGSAQPFFSK